MGEIAFWISVGAIIGSIFTALGFLFYRWRFYGFGEFVLIPGDNEEEVSYIGINVDSPYNELKSKKYVLLKKRKSKAEQ